MMDHSPETLYYDYLETDLGLVIMAVNKKGLCHAAFQDGPKMNVPPGNWKRDVSGDWPSQSGR